VDEICISSLKNDYFRHFYMKNAYGQSDASKTYFMNRLRGTNAGGSYFQNGNSSRCRGKLIHKGNGASGEKTTW
jgi:hypothetical protein